MQKLSFTGSNGMALFGSLIRIQLVVVIATLGAGQFACAETVATCGKGWLERIDGYPVLHLKGTPHEMGYQHGALMKEHCRENLDYLLRVKGGEAQEVELGPLKMKVSPRTVIDGIIAVQKKHVPQKYFEEMDGLAAGAELKKEDIYAANFIPEMFHCSGFALLREATSDATVYHGRVLDYAIDWKLQEHAVLVVAEPDGEIPFVNVTYAGFVGSVTGMNMQHVSIGEMGGRGLGHWDGVPMAFLVREVLQTADSLEAALDIFRSAPRTCEYYYVIADGQTNQAAGLATTWETMETIQPGERHDKLPHPVPHTVLMSADDRYEELARRTRDGYGKFDAQSALRLMDRPVAMKSNLHNALFAPASTKLWVANASSDGAPAATQSYHAFQLSELLERKPASNAKQIVIKVR
jgi:isopenicillin-N N-acyltransferase-like protein